MSAADARRPRAPLSARLLAASPAILALLEVVVFVLVFRAIGWWALLAVVALSVLGLLVISSSSKRAWRDIRQMRAGERGEPRRTASDAAITLVGGVLLAVPGFVTALLGVVLLLPFTRSMTRRLVGYLVTRRVGRALGVQVHYGAGRSFGGPVVPGEQAHPSGRPGTSSEGDAGRHVIEGRIVGEDDDEPPRR